MMGESYRNIFGYSRDFTVKDYLEYVAALKDVPARETTKKINYLLDILTLSDVKRKKIAKLSGGMKRRVGIAQAMLNDPKILILDEPTAGLDPNERIRFRNLISELAENRLVRGKSGDWGGLYLHGKPVSVHHRISPPGAGGGGSLLVRAGYGVD